MLKIFRESLAILLALMALQAPANAQTWHRADTANFILYSDGSLTKLEEFATELEMFDALFRQNFNLSTEPPPNRLTIYLLKDSEAVGELAGSKSTAGFYRPSSEGSLAVANRERGRGRTSLSGQTVLQHEYVHHLMARFFTFGYPAWYREGFAEFFASAEFRSNGDWSLGEPAQYRAYALRQVPIPLEAVLFSKGHRLTSLQTDAFYGRSWLLVHKTFFDAQRRAQLVDYLSRIGAGEDEREAFAATFGDVEALEAELDSYMRGRLSVLKSQAPIAYSGRVESQTLGEAESKLVPLRLHRRLEFKPEENIAALRSLAAEFPDNGNVLAELALAERNLAEKAEEPDYTVAKAAAQRALAVAPDNPAMNLLMANVEMERLEKANIYDNDQWDDVRRLIFRSLNANPSNPRGFLAQYQTFQKQGIEPPVEVINGLGEALRLAPEAHDIRIAYAFALANENLFDDAIRLVEFLASDPHNGAAAANCSKNCDVIATRYWA